MKRTIVSACSVCIAAALLATACTRRPVRLPVFNAPPATVTFRNVAASKPPLRNYSLRLDLVNRDSRPKWFVLRYALDAPLPATNAITAGEEDRLLFGDSVLSRGERVLTKEWDRATSRTVQCIGRFQALQLPAHGELHLTDCEIEAWAPVREFEIWEASEIMINGTIPLKQWVAARTLAPEGHYATLSDANRDPRDPDAISRSSVPLFRDLVTSVEFRDVRKWTLPIARIDRQPRDPWGM